MPERRDLHYESPSDAIADIESLRRSGCEPCGSWSLEQACWHLNTATRPLMENVQRVPNTPEQTALQPLVETVLVTGKLPSGIQSPERALPPADAPASAVDDFIATLKKLENFPGPFGTHRRFGNLPDEQIRRLALIHTAHHLSHLVPNSTAR